MTPAASTPFLAPSRRRYSPAELRLFLHAVRLARAAQAVGRSASLSEVAAAMGALRNLPHGVGPAAADRATTRACGRLARWSRARDSCLVRALVLGVLLCDRPGVVLHVGFRGLDSATAVLGGHAWVTLDGTVVPRPEAALLAGEAMEEAFTISLGREPAHRSPGTAHAGR